jgi:hypothetical protein
LNFFVAIIRKAFRDNAALANLQTRRFSTGQKQNPSQQRREGNMSAVRSLPAFMQNKKAMVRKISLLTLAKVDGTGFEKQNQD